MGSEAIFPGEDGTTARTSRPKPGVYILKNTAHTRIFHLTFGVFIYPAKGHCNRIFWKLQANGYNV